MKYTEEGSIVPKCAICGNTLLVLKLRWYPGWRFIKHERVIGDVWHCPQEGDGFWRRVKEEVKDSKDENDIP